MARSFRGTPVTLSVRDCPPNSARRCASHRATFMRIRVLSLLLVARRGQFYEREFWSVNHSPLLSFVLSP